MAVDADNRVYNIEIQRSDKGADVALRPGEDEIALAPQLPHGVDPGRKALDRRLLVPGRTVELPGTV